MFSQPAPQWGDKQNPLYTTRQQHTNNEHTFAITPSNSLTHSLKQHPRANSQQHFKTRTQSRKHDQSTNNQTYAHTQTKIITKTRTDANKQANTNTDKMSRETQTRSQGARTNKAKAHKHKRENTKTHQAKIPEATTRANRPPAAKEESRTQRLPD